MRGSLSPAHTQVTESYNEAAYEQVESAQWVALEDKGFFGTGLVHILNDTHLHFEYIRTTTMEVHDEIWLVKDRA